MKIAFVNHTFIMGSGIDSLIYQYTKRLGTKHMVHIFCLRTDYGEQQWDELFERYKEVEYENFKLHKIEMPFGKERISSTLAPLVFRPWNKIDLEQFDIVVTQLYPGTLLPKLKHPKWVHIEWSTPEGIYNSWQERAYFRLQKWGNEIGCKRADLVLTPSKFVHDYVLKNYKVESKQMYLDGIDFELFDKSKYDNRFDTNNILYVGRIAPHKNLEALIRAFALVKKEIPDATLILAGSLPFPNYTRKIIRLLDELIKDWTQSLSVELTSTVPWQDLPKYYANCILWCSPTKWEGFLKSEAYAFEKPMVALDYTSNCETVQDNFNGLLVRVGTPQDLAGNLILLLRNKAMTQELGQNGHKWAKENLDINTITDNLEAVFNELVATSKNN